MQRSREQRNQIIYLNGPSSSGKTCLTKALQKVLDEPYLHVGIDKVIGMMPEKVNDWLGGAALEGFSWKKVGETQVLQQGPFAKRISGTYRDIALLLASQGYKMIIDDVALGGASEVDEWRRLLEPYEVLFVGLTAPLDVIEKREQERGDRIVGSSRDQWSRVHEGASYDLFLDSAAQLPDALAEKILSAIG